MSHNKPATTSPMLIVEDDVELGDLLADVLGAAGFDCLKARSGHEALQLARTEVPGFVLLDVHLPDISGYEVYRCLREARGASLPIIFISGERTESFDRVGGLLLGADDYVTKPFAIDELLARIRPTLVRQASAQVSTGITRKGLTAREAEVLCLLARGRQQHEIASALRISARTVGTHIEHILMKLGAQSRAQAVALAYNDNLIDEHFPGTFGASD